MSKLDIPICFFPSTVAFVDDSQDFLINFTLQLDPAIAYKVFQSPYKAFEAIRQGQRRYTQINQRVVSEYIENHAWPLTNQTISLDLSTIHWEVYNPQRFDEKTVIVVDYAMPGMDGMELCEKLEESPALKILLTGQADEKTAIQAFNRGLIDCYIQKNDPHALQILNSSVNKLQQQYFKSMSDAIAKMLAVNSPNCLQDAKFANFFYEICQKKKIVEFYLIESSGSFLLLDELANIFYLIVKNDHDLKLHYDLAKDSHAPEAILQDLKLGQKIPFYNQCVGNPTQWSDWEACLYTAQTIECQEIYYYALIESKLSLGVNRNKILSYRDYLQNLDTNFLNETTVSDQSALHKS